MNLLKTKAGRSWAVLMVLGALAGCGDPAAPLPAEGAPDELTFDISGYGGSSTTVRMEGGEVVVTRTPWDYKPGMRRDIVRVVPSAHAWAAFLAAAENAGVRQWRREYRAENFVDGTAWSLSLANDGVAIQSQGVNAYPDREGGEHEIHVTRDFGAFLDALGTLTGWNFTE